MASAGRRSRGCGLADRGLIVLGGFRPYREVGQVEPLQVTENRLEFSPEAHSHFANVEWTFLAKLFDHSPLRWRQFGSHCGSLQASAGRRSRGCGLLAEPFRFVRCQPLPRYLDGSEDAIGVKLHVVNGAG